jgi:hypothetical protein
MPVPLPVKIASAVLNIVVVLAGLRNVFAPGEPIPLPDDNLFQAHFHGEPPSDSKMAWIFQLFGSFMLMSAFAKLTVVFGHSEGTFLRQQLLFVFGCLDLVCARVVFSYDGFGEKTFDVLGGFGILHAIEGVAFISDAIFRERVAKDAKVKAP